MAGPLSELEPQKCGVQLGVLWRRGLGFDTALLEKHRLGIGNPLLVPLGCLFVQKGLDAGFGLGIEHVLDHDIACVGVGLIGWHL